jgi:hypothetical protein
MLAMLEGISSTRISGELSYAVTLAAAVWVTYKQRSSAGARVFGSPVSTRFIAGVNPMLTVACVQFVLLLDMAFNWRWKLHDFLAGDAEANNLYAGRRPVQVLVLEILAVLLICAAGLLIFRLRHRPGVAIAMAGTLLSLGMWCTEVISYHNVDHILYHMVGSLMVVSFIWIALCCFTTLGVLIEGRR